MDYEFHDYEDEYTPLEGGRDRPKAKKKKVSMPKNSTLRRPPPSDTTYRGKNFGRERQHGCLCRLCCSLCSCWTMILLLSTLWATWLALWLVNTYLLGPDAELSNGTSGHGVDNATLVRIPYEMASEKGAFCLDGSAPAFYYKKGQRDGAASWILHLPDGQWCYNATDCFQRSLTSLGSSSNIPTSVRLSGILAGDPKKNPDFYDWNVVQLHYCDGSSFASDSPSPLSVLDDGVIYQRGALILETIISFLLNTTDMASARRVILSGTGSGGLGVFIHADHVGTLLPAQTSFHALADSAFYPDSYNRSNYMHIRLQFQRLFNLHHLSENFDESCVESKLVEDPGSTWQCMFPQYSAQFVNTPLFISNSMYDPWSLWFILNVRCYPQDCPDLVPLVERFGADVVEKLKYAKLSEEDGVFVTSCYRSNLISEGWDDVSVNGTSLNEAFAEWYFNIPFNGTDQARPNKRTVAGTLLMNGNSKKAARSTSGKLGAYWRVDCVDHLLCNSQCDWTKDTYQRISARLEEMDDFFIQPVNSRSENRRRALSLTSLLRMI